MSIPGDDVEFAFLTETSFLVIASADNPLMLQVYDIDRTKSEPILRASFSLPRHSNTDFNHWLYLNVRHTSNRGPFRVDMNKSIVVLEFSPLNVRHGLTYTLVIRFEVLIKLSDPPDSDDVRHGPLFYQWEEWGPEKTRLLAWEPTGKDGRGSVFGSRYGRGLTTADGGARLLVLDFNPATPLRQQERYQQLLDLTNVQRLGSSTSSAIAGQVRGTTTISGGDLFADAVSTSLPFVMDIAAGDIPSPCVQLDYEHVLVTQVRCAKYNQCTPTNDSQSYHSTEFEASILALV